MIIYRFATLSFGAMRAMSGRRAIGLVGQPQGPQ